MVLGERVWDEQGKFRLRVGPLSFAQFREFLPGGASLRPLAQMARLFVDAEFDFDVQLVLKADEVPECQLSSAPGAGACLGRYAWLKSRAPGAGRRRRRLRAGCLIRPETIFPFRRGEERIMGLDSGSLIKKLNKTCLDALQGAAGLCLSRTNPSVEIEHWLLKLAEAPDTDLNRLFRALRDRPVARPARPGRARSTGSRRATRARPRSRPRSTT